MEEAEVIQGYFVVNRTMLEMQEKAKGKEKQVSELIKVKSYLIVQFSIFRESTPSVNYHI